MVMNFVWLFAWNLSDWYLLSFTLVKIWNKWMNGGRMNEWIEIFRSLVKREGSWYNNMQTSSKNSTDVVGPSKVSNALTEKEEMLLINEVERRMIENIDDNNIMYVFIIKIEWKNNSCNLAAMALDTTRVKSKRSQFVINRS